MLPVPVYAGNIYYVWSRQKNNGRQWKTGKRTKDKQPWHWERQEKKHMWGGNSNVYNLLIDWMKSSQWPSKRLSSLKNLRWRLPILKLSVGDTSWVDPLIQRQAVSCLWLWEQPAIQAGDAFSQLEKPLISAVSPSDNSSGLSSSVLS